MKIKSLLLVSVATILASTAFAQKFEVYGDYSYMQFNPTLSGLQSRALNGGGGGFQFNMGKYFGIKGDFQAYGSTQLTYVVSSATPVTVDGTNYVILPGTYKSSVNQFTYMFGPVIQAQTKHFTPFGEVLFGGSNASLYQDVLRSTNIGGGITGSQHPFTMAIGGGLDLNINKRFAVRLAEMDYMLTRATNPLTSTNNQNSFRYLGGIVVRFGE